MYLTLSMLCNILWFWLLAGHKSLGFLNITVQACHGRVYEHLEKDVPDWGGACENWTIFNGPFQPNPVYEPVNTIPVGTRETPQTLLNSNWSK